MQNSEEGNIHIREVWRDNLDFEIGMISKIVRKYPYVTLGTKFPGHVLQPAERVHDYNYKKLKENVDILKLIQLGFTFFDEKGNLPTCETDKNCIWQINFCDFNPNKDICFDASIKLLSHYGIDFKRNNENGVSASRFSELLMTSGVLGNNDVRFIIFQGLYDLGFLVKSLEGEELPDTEGEFLDLVKVYFPNLYDIKHLMKYHKTLSGELDNVAQILGARRLVGHTHQAGSDSFVTYDAFLRLIERHYGGGLPDEHANVLFGLGHQDNNQKSECTDVRCPDVGSEDTSWS